MAHSHDTEINPPFLFNHFQRPYPNSATLSDHPEIGEPPMATDTDEDFLIERMAKARFKYNRIMPIEAAIYNLRLSVDQSPQEIVDAHGLAGQRAWAYMRDANGGNALSKLSRYETSLLRDYDRSRQELEKLQKIRAAKSVPPPISEKLRKEPDPPITAIESALSPTCKPAPGTRNPRPFEAPSPEPLL
jgi:hypothetical protein